MDPGGNVGSSWAVRALGGAHPTGSGVPDLRAGEQAEGSAAGLRTEDIDRLVRNRLPVLPREHLARLALSRRLEEVSGSAVVSVVAPAGAGKSLGVAGWIRATGRAESTLWINATPALGPNVLRELLGVADSRSGEGGPRSGRGFTSAASAPPQPNRPHRVVSIGEPARGDTIPGGRPLLVLDDAEHLPGATIGYLDELLNQDPELLRVVLISRWDLPFTRLVPELLGQLSVLRGELFRLDDGEATALAKQHARTARASVLDAIVTHAEGWCAAVVLTARAVGAAADPVAAAERLRHCGSAVSDRIVDEVFSTLTERQRHLLLCLAGEATVTIPTATHLSHDPRAGELLADLEATGLLVTRSSEGYEREKSASGGTRSMPSDDEPPLAFKIHPLLSAVARRRLSAGGVDVARARGAVVRAVHLDLAGGDVASSFRRLVAYDEAAEVARLLAEHGLALQMGGHADAIRAFVISHPSEIESHPDTWFSVGLERWVANDVTAACHWLDRTDTRRREAGREPDAETACIGLMRSRLGLESVTVALERARQVLAAEHGRSTRSPLLPLLLLELGVAENWLGHLRQAEAHLSAAALSSRRNALTGLRTEALSHLVFTEYMLGRGHACVDLAEESLQLLALQPWQPTTTTARVAIALELAKLQDLPWHSAPAGRSARRYVVHDADPTTEFWAHLLAAMRSLSEGSVVEAERVLDVPVEAPSLPRHLRVAALLERSITASLATDRNALRTLSHELDRLGAPAEQALIAGIRADLLGDPHRADEFWRETVEHTDAAQPGTVAMGLACRAQIVDAMGRHEEADRLMHEAALATEVPRNAVPFLGWSRQGTPMPVLLARLNTARPTSWVRELAEASAQYTGLGAFFGPVTATPRERAHAAPAVAAPVLSPREREVLHELARGSTYADIAANLVVSENTVKTHVSSLYAKLAVKRRSEALAVARTSHLL